MNRIKIFLIFLLHCITHQTHCSHTDQTQPTMHSTRDSRREKNEHRKSTSKLQAITIPGFLKKALSKGDDAEPETVTTVALRDEGEQTPVANKHESARGPLEAILLRATKINAFADLIDKAHIDYAAVATPEQMRLIKQLQKLRTTFDGRAFADNLVLNSGDFPPGTQATAELELILGSADVLEEKWVPLETALKLQLSQYRQVEYEKTRTPSPETPPAVEMSAVRQRAAQIDDEIRQKHRALMEEQQALDARKRSSMTLSASKRASLTANPAASTEKISS